jgi:hypothetical protein
MTVNELITKLDLLPADADVWLSIGEAEATDFTVELDGEYVVLEGE